VRLFNDTNPTSPVTLEPCIKAFHQPSWRSSQIRLGEMFSLSRPPSRLLRRGLMPHVMTTTVYRQRTFVTLTVDIRYKLALESLS
jgi:hypothetical protein